MTAVISTTYNDKYLWNLPLVTWCWNRLGVDVICFLPVERNDKDYAKIKLAMQYCNNYRLSVYQFSCPEHKEATYSQCSRLYAACLDLPEDEILITSDVDMAFFSKGYAEKFKWNGIGIFGSDLVTDEQYPMCYASMPVSSWRDIMGINGRTYQQCLDDEIGSLESISFRGDFWCRDQWLLKSNISKKRPTDGRALHYSVMEHKRAKPGTQFAEKRYDRDDAFLLDRLSPDTIDYHMPRPGYEENNFNQILTVLKYHYPDEDFQWLVDYNNAYKQLL